MAKIKMSRYFITIIAISVVLIFSCIYFYDKTSGNTTVGRILEEKEYDEYMTNSGKSLSSLYNDFERYNSEVYAKGNRGTVTMYDYEIVKINLLESGYDEETAQNIASETVLSNEALYQEAISLGYTITAEEVNEYINMLKESLNVVSNKESVEKKIAQFDSEEDYWDFKAERCEKGLVIDKYLKDLKNEMNKVDSFNLSLNNSTNADIEQSEWDDYLSDLKEGLVEKEKFIIQD